LGRRGVSVVFSKEWIILPRQGLAAANFPQKATSPFFFPEEFFDRIKTKNKRAILTFRIIRKLKNEFNCGKADEHSDDENETMGKPENEIEFSSR